MQGHVGVSMTAQWQIDNSVAALLISPVSYKS
jgi:hypothetical protein